MAILALSAFRDQFLIYLETPSNISLFFFSSFFDLLWARFEPTHLRFDACKMSDAAVCLGQTLRRVLALVVNEQFSELNRERGIK